MTETAASRTPIAVFLLNDHEVVRRGVRELLEAESDITVVRQARLAGGSVDAVIAWEYPAGIGGFGWAHGG